MPFLIPAIGAVASYAFAAAISTAGFAATFSAATAFTIAALTTAATLLATPSTPRRPVVDLGDRLQQAFSEAAPRRVIYGKARVAPQPIAHSEAGNWTVLIYALCEHDFDSIEEVYINNGKFLNSSEITSLNSNRHVSVNSYSSSDTDLGESRKLYGEPSDRFNKTATHIWFARPGQLASTLATGPSSSIFDSMVIDTGGMQGVSTSFIIAAFPSPSRISNVRDGSRRPIFASVPTLQVSVDRGGVGLADLPASYQVTTTDYNAARTLYDYASKYTDYGTPVFGKDRIDFASFASAMTVCETENWRVHGMTTLADSNEVVFEHMMFALGGGWVSDVGGILHVRANTEIVADHTITEDHILPGWSVSPQTPRSDRFSNISLSFVNENGEIETITHQNEDAQQQFGEKEQIIETNFIRGSEQALRLAGVLADRAYHSTQIDLPMDASGLALNPGDVVSIDSDRLGLDHERAFLVVNKSINFSNMSVRISLLEYSTAHQRTQVISSEETFSLTDGGSADSSPIDSDVPRRFIEGSRILTNRPTQEQELWRATFMVDDIPGSTSTVSRGWSSGAGGDTASAFGSRLNGFLTMNESTIPGITSARTVSYIGYESQPPPPQVDTVDPDVSLWTSSFTAGQTGMPEGVGWSQNTQADSSDDSGSHTSGSLTIADGSIIGVTGERIVSHLAFQPGTPPPVSTQTFVQPITTASFNFSHFSGNHYRWSSREGSMTGSLTSGNLVLPDGTFEGINGSRTIDFINIERSGRITIGWSTEQGTQNLQQALADRRALRDLGNVSMTFGVMLDGQEFPQTVLFTTSGDTGVGVASLPDGSGGFSARRGGGYFGFSGFDPAFSESTGVDINLTLIGPVQHTTVPTTGQRGSWLLGWSPTASPETDAATIDDSTRLVITSGAQTYLNAPFSEALIEEVSPGVAMFKWSDIEVGPFLSAGQDVTDFSPGSFDAEIIGNTLVQTEATSGQNATWSFGWEPDEEASDLININDSVRLEIVEFVGGLEGRVLLNQDISDAVVVGEDSTEGLTFFQWADVDMSSLLVAGLQNINNLTFPAVTAKIYGTWPPGSNVRTDGIQWRSIGLRPHGSGDNPDFTRHGRVFLNFTGRFSPYDGTAIAPDLRVAILDENRIVQGVSDGIIMDCPLIDATLGGPTIISPDRTDDVTQIQVLGDCIEGRFLNNASPDRISSAAVVVILYRSPTALPSNLLVDLIT